jgi:hypothetical protein
MWVLRPDGALQPEVPKKGGAGGGRGRGKGGEPGKGRAEYALLTIIY